MAEIKSDPSLSWLTESDLTEYNTKLVLAFVNREIIYSQIKLQEEEIHKRTEQFIKILIAAINKRVIEMCFSVTVVFITSIFSKTGDIKIKAIRMIPSHTNFSRNDLLYNSDPDVTDCDYKSSSNELYATNNDDSKYADWDDDYLKANSLSYYSFALYCSTDTINPDEKQTEFCDLLPLLGVDHIVFTKEQQQNQIYRWGFNIMKIMSVFKSTGYNCSCTEGYTSHKLGCLKKLIFKYARKYTIQTLKLIC